MLTTITYSLRLKENDSQEYYRTIAAFAERWTPATIQAIRDILIDFQAYRAFRGLPIRSDAEYALELLAIGVLLLERAPQAMRWPAWITRVYSSMIQVQERWPWAEAPVKILRGLAMGLAGDQSRQNLEGLSQPETLSLLSGWLRSQDEGNLADRLDQWVEYLMSLEPEVAWQLLERSLDLTECFAQESSLVLGKYTANVPTFLSQTAPKHRWRYDAAFISRSRLEYHLAMLANEVLNRAYRQRFLETKHKVVIVPPCMRAQPDSDCQAVETPLGAKCQACKPNCRVHQVTRLGKKYGFEVYIIPDELRNFSSQAGRNGDPFGLVGVSCVLTNWSGGWEADALGVPAQGVLLDYVGCRYHWDDQGVSTDTNIKKLEEVLGLTPPQISMKPLQANGQNRDQETPASSNEVC